MMNACLNCKYREAVHNSRHSSCKHPIVQNMDCETLAVVIKKLADKEEIIQIPGIKVKLDKIGIKGKWALWPFNLDPIWLVHCSGYERRD